MTATIWFDPTCPYTWATGRWLRATAAGRGEDVEWRVMSLAVLNAGNDVPEEYREPMRLATLASRVLVAAATNVDRDALYTALGTRVHENGEPLSRETVAAAVADAGLPDTLLAAYDDAALDALVLASHEAGQARVGAESGSPVVAFDDAPGYFGPIVTAIPTGDDAARLYDAVRLLSTVPQFAEIKGSR